MDAFEKDDMEYRKRMNSMRRGPEPHSGLMANDIKENRLPSLVRKSKNIVENEKSQLFIQKDINFDQSEFELCRD